METHDGWRFRGRGAANNPTGRFESRRTLPIDDGWGSLEQPGPAPLETHLHVDSPRAIITTNDSPDIPFDQSLNPYQGCEHGCTYCYARAMHAFWNHSPGLEFETELYYKPTAPQLLEEAFRKPSYQVLDIALGSSTDPYQPIERQLRLTRRILEVFLEYRHPVRIATRSNLILRDLDLLVPLAEQRLLSVFLSVTTLDRSLARQMEPRAPTPARRLEAIAALAEAGIPVGMMAAPLIPGLNEPELEALLKAGKEAGAAWAGYILVRLPHEVKDVFLTWLYQTYPEKAGRVESLLRQARAGALNSPAFGTRMKGEGPVAELIARRFHVTSQRLGLGHKSLELDRTRFRRPARPGDQLRLFDV